MSFLARLFGSAAPVPTADEDVNDGAPLWSTHWDGATRGHARKAVGNLSASLAASQPVTTGADTLDDSEGGTVLKEAFNLAGPNMPEMLLAWYGSQGFIGHQTAAILAQHWLIDKACTMPARDAVRHGFEISMPGDLGGPDEIKALEKADKRHRLRYHLQDFVRKGRIFGIRIALFKVESTDPLYYEKPFNPDGVTAGSYKGVVQLDPYWCSPMMDAASVNNPASLHFYEPTWWWIMGRKYHRSHLCIFRSCDVPDLLKPSYGYGGVPVPQRIMERVYAAERTANEAPQLAMTKRTTVWNTDLAQILANQEAFAMHMQNFIDLRDNYGVKVNDTTDTMQQFDTSLADLDATIMTQYQLVAAAANVPATKLLGTTPKGFNATGEYEEASYHEELETVQENDLTPLVERHHLMVLRSEIEPKFGHPGGALTANIDWRPLDSPTAKERAEVNDLKAKTDETLARAGAIDGMDIRNRIRKDGDSGYKGLPEQPVADLTDPLGLNTDPLALDPLAVRPGEGGEPEDVLAVRQPVDDPLAVRQPAEDPLAPRDPLAVR